MSRPPPISTRTDTLLPYPTFFRARLDLGGEQRPPERRRGLDGHGALHAVLAGVAGARHGAGVALPLDVGHVEPADARRVRRHRTRSEEHTSELQSLMRISYAVFCLKKKNTQPTTTQHTIHVI